MQRTRAWFGTVDPNGRDEHERFVEWLRTDEAAVQYAKFGLTSYRLAQNEDRLTITMATDSEDPTTMIRFLRNHRMWPDFWRYESATPAGAEQGEVRVEWQRSRPGTSR